jgi:hypothetical protein
VDREDAVSQEQTADPHRSSEDQPDEEQNKGQLSDPDQPPAKGTGKTRPMAPYDASEAGGPIPELDEGPRAEPVDEVQEAIFEATQKGISTELEVDDLPGPVPDLDEGPRPAPVDEVQEAIFEASREGVETDVDFDQLPEPGATRPQKIVRFKEEAPPSEPEPEPLIFEPEDEPVPMPEFPEPDPVPTVSDFWLQLALFVTLRGLTLFLLRPGGFIRDWSDFDTYFGIAALSDYSLYPFLDFWLEWPPLVPWLAVGSYRLSLLLPPWPDDPRLWFILILGTVFVLFEIGNFVLIYRLARRLFEQPTTISRVLWIYAGLFPPIYAMLGFFDGVALFFILLALEFLLDDRRFLSAVAVGVGFMVKIVPVLMLPVALRRLWYQYRENGREAGIEMGLYAVIFGLTVLALLAPFLIGGSEWVMASARAMLGRSSWETVWAVAEGYYGFGVVLGDRLNPAETNFAAHESVLPWWLITLAFAGLYAFLFTRPADYSRPRHVVAFSGLTVVIFMLYSKGYSPQFLVYLLPFILLLFPNGRGLTYVLILTGLNVLEQPVYFVLLPDTTWLLTFIVIVRTVLLLIIALEFALVLWPLERRLPFVFELRRRGAVVLGGLAAATLLVLIPVLLQAYFHNRLQEDPVAAFTGFMQTWGGEIDPTRPNIDKPRLLLSDQPTYRQVYPHLHQAFEVQLADGAAKYDAAPGVTDLLAGLDQVWILPTGPAQQPLRNVVDRRGQPLANFDFEGVGTASLYSFEANPRPFIAPARFIGGIELLAHQVAVNSGAVEVTLYWRAVDPQSQSYTVFTQLLDAEGQQVAGHDNIPADGTAPTDSWPVNAVQADRHRIELPADLPPGEYTLIVGLYNRFGERLRAIDPDGFGYAGRAVPLATVQLR